MSASQSDRFSHMVQTTWMHLSRESPWRMKRRWTSMLWYQKQLESWVMRRKQRAHYFLWGKTFSLVELFCHIVSNESRTFSPLLHIRDALANETWQCSNCIPQCNKVCYSVPRPFLLQAKGLARETSTCTPITETNSLLHYHSIFTHVSPFPLDDQFFIIFSGIPCVNIQIFCKSFANLYTCSHP